MLQNTRITYVLSLAFILAAASVGFGQAKAKPLEPNAIIKNLYKAQTSNKGPFFQTKSRVLVDKYFTKDLADLIWKDAVNSKGEIGNLDFDPLYNSQDPDPKDFVIMDTGWGGDAKFGPADEAVVQVTFKQDGKEFMVSFRFHQQKSKQWKIYDIRYAVEGEDDMFLKAILSGK